MQPEVHFLPDDIHVRVRPGTTLLDAAKAAKAPVRTRCGGKAACLMCKVNVADQRGLNAPTLSEEIKLGPLLRQGYRLACQAKVRGDVAVDVPEDPLKAAVRRQLARLRQSGDDDDINR